MDLTTPPPFPSDSPAGGLEASFRDALLAGDGAKAERIARENLEAGFSLAQVYRRVLQPALEQIGEHWERGAISVADEHLATTLCQRVMAALYVGSLAAPTEPRSTVLLAGVEGEQHRVGLRMVADALEIAGFEVIELGPGVPAEDLVGAVRHHAPSVVGLSVTMPSGERALTETLVALAQHAPDVHVLCGGQGIPPHLRAPGTGYVADVESAVTRVETITAGEVRRRSGERTDHRAEVRAVASVEATVEDQLADAASELASMTREQARLAQRYRALAYEDPVSGLPNRRAFDEELERAAREGSVHSLLVLDLDRFKDVNDSRGHEEGDRMLRQTGLALAQELRGGDFAARLGGDEFAVILRSMTFEETGLVAERIRRRLREALRQWHGTASIGVSVLGEDGRLAVLDADRALYAAKDAGRDRVRRGGDPAGR